MIPLDEPSGLKWGNQSLRQLNRGRLRGSCGILPAEEAQDIGRRKLVAQTRPEHSGPEAAQALVEVAPDRHEIADVDVCRAAARMQAPGGHAAGGIAVAGSFPARQSETARVTPAPRTRPALPP